MRGEHPALSGALRGFRPGTLGTAVLRLYRLAFSPLLGDVCRFEPSCSVYAEEAFQRHGALRASWLVLGRLARCHPFHPGGLDPVP